MRRYVWRVLPWLLPLIQDSDVDIRVSAVAGLPLALDEPTADHPVIGIVLDLLRDPEPRIRDMAAFTLGTQLTVDSPEIREGLRALLDEPDSEDAYPAAEAAVGLARRGDREIWTTVRDRLRQPGPGVLWLETAKILNDTRLVPMLLNLRVPDNEPDDPWVQMLEATIAHCTAT